MSDYSDKLKDPRWQKQRLEILDRDNFSCTKCGDDESTLHVHHRYYDNHLDPWEYPNDSLETLCEDCHHGETEFMRYVMPELTKALRMRYTAPQLSTLLTALEDREVCDKDTASKEVISVAWMLLCEPILGSVFKKFKGGIENG